MNYNGTIFFYKETNDSFHTIEREYGKNSGQIVATFQTDKYLVEGVAGNANQNRSVLTSDNEKALELFCFLSENSGDSKEWQLNTYSTTEGEVYMLGTTPGKKTVNVSSLEAMNNLSSSDKTNSLHSHPGIAGTIGGSGYDGTYGDKQNIEYWETQNPGATSPTWFVYHTETRRFYQYDKNNQNLSNDGMTIDEYKKR